MNCVTMGSPRIQQHLQGHLGYQVKVDPMMFFSFLFGSERFEAWIGELYMDLLIKCVARGATVAFVGMCIERAEKRAVSKWPQVL